LLSLTRSFHFATSGADMQTPTSDDLGLSPGGDGASQAQSRVAETGHKVAAAIDDRRDAVARGIDSAASTLREKAGSLPGGEKVARAAYTAADAMETAAGYVRDQDLKAILSDLQQTVKKHPGATLLAAAAVGFLIARSFSRH
jgi:hypothetical protein